VRCLWLAALALVLNAQPPEPSALLSTTQLLQAHSRSIQLMESTGVALPELAHASASLVESARQLSDNVRADPANGPANYKFLTNLRTFIALADAVAKPFPFSEEAQKQLHELQNVQARLEAHFRALIAQKDLQLRNPDRDNLTRYSEDNTRIGPPKSGKPRVVFLGDSITDIWRLNEYFPDRDFVNRGISGQITGQMLARMESDVIRLQPTALVVLGGTNDIARGIALTTIEDNLAMLAELATYYQIKVIFSSVLPVSDYHKDVNPNYEQTRGRPLATLRALNDWLKTYCTKRSVTYIDYYSKLTDGSGFLKSDLSDDGLHPNSSGYRLMAPVVLDAIDKITSASPAPQQKKHKLFGK
jgi:lysophospholipase L1-like esterase